MVGKCFYRITEILYKSRVGGGVLYSLTLGSFGTWNYLFEPVGHIVHFARTVGNKTKGKGLFMAFCFVYNVLYEIVIVFSFFRLEFLPQSADIYYGGIGIIAFLASVFGNVVGYGIALVVLGFGVVVLGQNYAVGIKLFTSEMLKACKTDIRILLFFLFIIEL